MTKLLLSLHVLAAILAVGPIAVAASMFPRLARLSAAPAGAAVGASGADGMKRTVGTDGTDGASEEGEEGEEDGRGAAGAVLLHRICRAYAVVGVSVPVLGIATGAQLGVLTDAWLLASLVLTTLAAVLLGAVILPAQSRLLESPPPNESGLRALTGRLAGLTGVFNLVWAIVVVLMIVRPGSTTGA